MSRVGAVLDDAAFPPELADLLAGFAGSLNVYRVMAHSPALLRAWVPLRQHVVAGSALPADLREIAILRVGHHWGSGYEWAHHVVRSRALGIDEARIEAARAAPRAWPAGGADALILRLVDALLEDGCAAAELIDAGAAAFGVAALIDLMATIGMYTTLAFIVRSFATPLEPSIQAAVESRS